MSGTRALVLLFWCVAWGVCLAGAIFVAEFREYFYGLAGQIYPDSWPRLSAGELRMAAIWAFGIGAGIIVLFPR